MNYTQIISKVIGEPWLITEQKHHAILSVLESRLAGDFSTMEMDDGDEMDDGERDCYREVMTSKGVAAVIPIYGILGKHLSSMTVACGGCSLDMIQTHLKIATSSYRISSIILDVNSPGGTYTGTPETAKMIADANNVKPVYAFTDSDCCSGALWLASQARTLVATESAVLGSIGVRMILLDITKQLDEAGIKVNMIYSGKYKLIGAQFKALEPDEREKLQKESDDIWDDFKVAVNSVRAIDDANCQGQLFRGEEAQGIGLIDSVMGDMDEFIAAI
jgi:signal peptide peptidase SppA